MGKATHFFLGANSGLGFQNLFDKFCKESSYHDFLVLKGGPGCGKSTMMRRIGESMESRGETVEYLHCSGDPESLDGVRIPRLRTAVVDGTAPHVVEPDYPAAVGRYVDLGRFYNVGRIKESREDIISKSDACSEIYRSSYRVLGAARKLEEEASLLMLRELDFNKLTKRTKGIVEREIRGKGSGEKDRYRFLGSITAAGQIMRHDSVEVLCPRIYHLVDSFGGSAVMLQQIHQAARDRMYSSILCPDCENPERLQHLLIPELGVAFVTCREGMEFACDSYRRIHVDAMIAPEHRKRWRGRVKFITKMVATLREEATELLRQAKKNHDDLEALYHPHVDFSGLDALTKLEIERMVE